IHDFADGSDRIVFHSDISTVITGGGQSAEKTASADGSIWSTEQIADEDGSAFWRVQAVNTLPNEVTDFVVFDRLPASGDVRGSDLATTLTGPVQGSADAVIEYSADATAATNGTWSTSWEGATSWRATKDVAAVGEALEFIVPVQLDEGYASEQAVNQAAISYEYAGSPAVADTNEST
ncbi:MAG: hypothetical protein ACQEW8_15580, partial [Actinomycetota bacterium]